MRFMFSGDGEMKVITAFRMLRMLRVVRQIRLLRMFRDLWTVVKGRRRFSRGRFVAGLFAFLSYLARANGCSFVAWETR